MSKERPMSNISEEWQDTILDLSVRSGSQSTRSSSERSKESSGMGSFVDVAHVDHLGDKGSSDSDQNSSIIILDTSNADESTGHQSTSTFSSTGSSFVDVNKRDDSSIDKSDTKAEAMMSLNGNKEEENEDEDVSSIAVETHQLSESQADHESGNINDDMYCITGCESGVSRNSEISQFTHITTESTVTYKHGNITRNKEISDDFSIISENSEAIPVVTTLNSQEYKKERERLVMRKIALVEMSNAMKNPDRLDEVTASYSTVMAANNTNNVNPPPPPPPRLSESVAVIDPLITPVNQNVNSHYIFDNHTSNTKPNEIYNIRLLIKTGVLLLVGGVLGSYYSNNTCHFVSIQKQIGYYSETFSLHAGMYEYTSLDSVFTGHAFCLPYDEYYSSSEPTLPRLGGDIAVITGSMVSLIVWFYLIFLKSNRLLWKLGIFISIFASICQLSTFYFFFDDVCRNELCTIGPGSFMSFVAFVTYAVTANIMYRNFPTQIPITKVLNSVEDVDKSDSYSAPVLV